MLPNQTSLEPPLMWRQSTLIPAGPHADSIAALAWVMFIAGAAILLLVLALTAWAIFGGHSRSWMANRKFVIALGIVFPVAALTLLLIYGLLATRQLGARAEPYLRVEVIGERWWWRVHYIDQAGAVQLATANEIRIPTAKPVEFILKTQDVIHSFWVPNLAGKLDMIPGHVNTYQFAAEQAGVFRGQCAEYCGAQHALMAFFLVALPLEEFEAWYGAQSKPASEPKTSLASDGQRLFVAAGCGACHTVRGTPAAGDIGPDLTHIGSRISIAAGTYPMNAGTLAAWISSSQHLKPDNLMPSFGNLKSEELRAIVEYLEGLK